VSASIFHRVSERACSPVVSPVQSTQVAGHGRRWLTATAVVPYLFLAPFFVLFLAFIIVPLFYALYMSGFRDTLVGGRQFVGAANFIKVAGDAKFWEGVKNLAIFGIIQVPIMLGLALLFALILDRGHVYARGLFRLGFFLPYAVPSVIAALIWGYLYGPAFGPFTQLANMLNIPPPDFLSKDAMLFSVANIVTWEFVGYNMVIFYAALKAISADLSEAALIDGASPWQFAWAVQLPLLWPAILLAIIFSINGTLQLFNEPYLMRPLAPSVINSSYTPNLYAFSLTTANQQHNYAAAVSFVLGFVIAGASYIFTLTTNRRRR
jgi:multiple sugar transport system permease protein